MKDQGCILFCGVGGQGILLASEITAYSLLAAGLDVKKSEVHGMAQRGGSVVAHLRYGAKVYSPLIEPGRADIVVSFELMEAARYLSFMHRDSKVIVNTVKIPPSSVATGKVAYPADILEELRSRDLALYPIDGGGISKAIGEPRSANIALVGALSNFLPVAEEIFLEVINARVKYKIAENIKAFQEGRRVAQPLSRS